ncbi:MAG: DNA replication/repair protein RecF [Aestuariivita sp.]|nr:DNA replication/repair protein RecF [Aestuariivita sp.]
MSAFSSLSLSHFRSHRHSQISVDNRPIAILGPNGSGKTNILEAVSMFSPGRGLRNATIEEVARQPECLGWKLNGHITCQNRINEIEILAQAGSTRQIKINGKTTSQLNLGRITPVIWLVPAMDRLWIDGSEGRRRFLDRMALSFFPEHAAFTLKFQKAMRERNRLLKNQIRDNHWYEAIEHQMATTAIRIHQARIATLKQLTQAQSNCQTAFPTTDLDLSQNERDILENENDLKEALKKNRCREIIVGRTLIGPHRTDVCATYSAKGMPARNCSTGEQKAMLISLILANARALTEISGSSPILLLDEITAHLDNERRGALFDEIYAIGSQAWMTGTELDLFSEFGDKAQRISVMDNNGVSEITSS